MLEFFTQRTRSEREQLLRVWRELAASPRRKGQWLQKLPSGRELQVHHFRHWLIRYWTDDPVLEVRIVDPAPAGWETCDTADLEVCATLGLGEGEH